MLCGFEQQTKQQLPVAHAQAAQLLGQRKHQMEIGRYDARCGAYIFFVFR